LFEFGRQYIGPWSNWLFSDTKVDRTGLVLSFVKKARLSVVTGQFARALALILIFTQTALAQVTVDISKITCEQFIVLPKADSVAIWLSGYYNGGRHNSVLDMNKFEESARNLRAACRIPDNFNRPIMQVIESSIPK
jgi:hypothetical protein